MINSSLKRSFLNGLCHTGPISQQLQPNSLTIRSLATQSIEKLTEKYKQLGRLAESTKHPGEQDNALRFQAQTLEQIKKQGGASAVLKATEPSYESSYKSSQGSSSYNKARRPFSIPLSIKLLGAFPIALMAYEIADSYYEDTHPSVHIERALKRGFSSTAALDLEKIEPGKQREELALKIIDKLLNSNKDELNTTYFLEKALEYVPPSDKKEELIAKGVSIFLKQENPVGAYRIAITLSPSERKNQVLLEVSSALLGKDKKEQNSLITYLYIPDIIETMSPGEKRDEVTIALAHQQIAEGLYKRALKTVVDLPPSERKEQALLNISQTLLEKKETALAYSFLIKMSPSDKKDLALLDISDAFSEKEEYFYAKRALLEIRPGPLKDEKALAFALKLIPKGFYRPSQELINSMRPSEKKEQTILDFSNLLAEKKEYQNAANVLSHMQPGKRKTEAYSNLKGPIGPIIPVIAGLFMACAFTLARN
jgi:hypothetical protein